MAKATKLSFGSLAQLRIKDEDQLIPDDLVAGNMVDEWIRVRISSTSHKLGPDLRTARCGFPLDLWSEWYDEQVRPAFERRSGTDPGDWFMVVETRKDGRCKACKNEWALTDAKYIEDEPVSDYVEQTFMSSSIVSERSPSQERAAARFMSKVAWIAAELGAQIV